MSKKAKTKLKVVWEHKSSPDLKFRLCKALGMLISEKDLTINNKNYERDVFKKV